MKEAFQLTSAFSTYGTGGQPLLSRAFGVWYLVMFSSTRSLAIETSDFQMIVHKLAPAIQDRHIKAMASGLISFVTMSPLRQA
jgi:hypothetical protein